MARVFQNMTSILEHTKYGARPASSTQTIITNDATGLLYTHLVRLKLIKPLSLSCPLESIRNAP